MEKWFSIGSIICDIPPIFPSPAPIVDQPQGKTGIWLMIGLGIIMLGALTVGIKLIMILIQNFRDTKK